MGKIPVGQTIAYAYAFTFGNIAGVIGITWLPVLIGAVAGYFTFAPMVGAIASLLTSGHEPTPQDIVTTITPFVARVLLFVLVMWFLGSMIAVGLTRAALGFDHHRPVYFSLGRQVWLMLGALILYFVIYFLVDIVLEIGGFVVTLVVRAATQNQNAALIAGQVSSVLIFIALMYVSLRLSFLLAPVVVAEDRIDLKRGWDLAHGNVWRIVGISLAIFIPVAIVFGLIVSGVTVAFLPDVGGAPLRPQNIPSGLWAGVGIATMLYMMIICAMMYGANAFAYRALVPAPRADAVGESRE